MGLIVSTACVGGLPASIAIRGEAQGDTFDEIQKNLQNMSDRFVDAVGLENFNLEIQFNNLGIQHTTNKHLIALSESTGIPLVATADSHYYGKNLWEARELYRKLGRMGARGGELKLLPTFDELKCELYPKNATQMWEEFQLNYDMYDFYNGKEELVKSAIERTYDIAWDQCEEVWFDTSAKLPNFGSGEKSAFAELVDQVKAGIISMNLHEKPEYIKRAKEELDIIKKLGFENYFLTLTSVFEKAKKSTIIGPGRGSGGGSLVNYVLEITHIDPIKYGLLFERFLGLHKASWPDIDTDVGDRDVLIDVSKEMFGEDSVIPVSNFNTLKLKSLVKDVSKFYGVPFDEVNNMTNPSRERSYASSNG